MRIKTKLGAMAALEIAILVIMLPLLAWAFGQSTRAKDDFILANAIKSNFFRSEELAARWMLHRDDSTMRIWNEIKQANDRLLGEADVQFHQREDLGALKPLRHNLADSKAILDRMVRNSRAIKASDEAGALHEELDSRLASQRLIKAATIRDHITHLQNATARRLQETYEQQLVIVFLVALTLALATIATSLHLVRLIRTRLIPLHTGVRTVAQGNLEYRIRADGDDEFTELGQDINGMADKLHDFNRNLQGLVDARTKEIQSGKAILEAALASMGDAVFIADTGGRLLHSNPAFAVFHRFKDVLECARTLAEYPLFLELHLLNGDLVPMEQWPVSRALRGEYGVGVEFALQRRDSGDRWIGSYNYAPIRDENQVIVGAVVSVRDITDSKQSAILLLQAKEAAEAANRAKNTFLATMSHELRTPLNGVMGMIELASLRATDPKQMDHLAKAKRSSQNLLAIIQDILDVSRIEAGKLKLELADFSLDGLLGALDAMTRQKAVEKQLEFVIDLAPEIAAMHLHGDAQRLGQILLNLVGNGIKFTEQGSVRVMVQAQENLPTSVHLRFAVRDTGIGIAATDQSRLFKPFEQIDGSFTRKYGGSGLGLSICKQLVEMMDGTIGVESEAGVGSTFWFTVRLGKRDVVAPAEPRPASPSARSQLQQRHAGAFVLVVEDDQFNREVAQGFLEAAGLEVHHAANGSRAVEMARRTNYDLILMDVQMPLMDGLEATRHIRSASNNPHVPIVALTANVVAENEANCRQAGMDDFIGRPVDSEELYKTVLRWLGQPAIR